MLKKTMTFVKEQPQRAVDNTLIQTVHYRVGDKDYEYVCIGEDLEDLERDWAFKYLEVMN